MAKKKLIMIAGAVIVLAGGGAGAYFGGFLGKSDDTEKQEVKKIVPKNYVFYELPDILVNLNTRGQRGNSFLKIKISLELENADAIKTIETVQPRIIDNLQVYLRELRLEDLQGSEGLYRLREELLHRINMASAPVQVHDVLFAEMLMQ